MRALILVVLFSFALPLFAAAQQTVNARVTCYAPGGGGIQGGFATSRAGPNGGAYPRTLDDFRLGKSNFVTLAANPSRYGQWFDMGSISYVSNLDNRRYTLNKVVGYVHDTGCAFMVPGQSISCCSRYQTCSLAPRKFDIAYGKFAPGTNIGLIHSAPVCGNRDATWTQIGGPLTSPPSVTAGEYVDSKSFANSGNQSPYSGTNAPTAFQPQQAQPVSYQPTSNQPGSVQPTQYMPTQQVPGTGTLGPTFPTNLYQPTSVADKLLNFIKYGTTTAATTTATTTAPSITIILAEGDSIEGLDPDTIAHDSAPSTLPTPPEHEVTTSSNTFTSNDLSGKSVVPQQRSSVVNAFATVLDFLTNALLRIMDALRNLVN